MQARTKLIKNLEQQIEATTDPQLKADLSRQLTKLVTTAKRRGRPRKPEATPPLKKTRSLLDETGNSSIDSLPDGERFTHHLVLLAEAKCKDRGGWNALTRTEKDTLWEEIINDLSEEDRALGKGLGVLKG